MVINAGFEVLTTAVMKNSTFGDVPGRPLKAKRCFGETYRLLLVQFIQFLHADFLTGLFFCHENVGEMFIRNIG
jgi:hypothetical protein